jgi:hypothetical protein
VEQRPDRGVGEALVKPAPLLGGEENGEGVVFRAQDALDLALPRRRFDFAPRPADPLQRIVIARQSVQRRDEPAGRFTDAALADGDGQAVGDVDEVLRGQMRLLRFRRMTLS